MGDLISRKALLKAIEKSMIDNPHTDKGIKMNHTLEHQHFMTLTAMQPTAYDAECELRLLKNYLYHKSKAYRQRNQNFMVVSDLLMSGTSHAGMTSCIMKCNELGIDPYGYELKGVVKDEQI